MVRISIDYIFIYVFVYKRTIVVDMFSNRSIVIFILNVLNNGGHCVWTFGQLYFYLFFFILIANPVKNCRNLLCKIGANYKLISEYKNINSHDQRHVLNVNVSLIMSI
jgi:hypothetical protein